MLQKSLLIAAAAATCLFALQVQCEERRDVHRIILKTERSKKHAAKKPNMQQHKMRDHEAHGSIVHEDFTIPSRYNFSPDLQALMKPRPPHPHDFLITYPEEQLNFDHTYNVDTNAWTPVSSYEPNQSTGNRIKKKKLRRKPPSTEEPLLDFTTSKPLKSVHPVHFEHFVNFKKVAKKAPVKMHNSYEVYEEVQENEPPPPKSKKSALTAFNNLSPLPYSFKNSNHFLPTTYTQDLKYGIRVKGRKSH